MKRKPTFEMLRERRELPVVNPDNGVRFTISLKDWQGVLWWVKVVPDQPRSSDAINPYVQDHILMAHLRIEEWLEHLRLATNRAGTKPANHRHK